MFHNRVLNFSIWRIIEKDNLPSNTPQKYASAGHIYVQSLQWNTSKHYDRGLPTKLTLMTPTWLIKKKTMKSACYGIKSLVYLGPKKWVSVTSETQDLQKLLHFAKKKVIAKMVPLETLKIAP